MERRVTKSLSGATVSPSNVVGVVAKEILPVLSEVRRLLNGMFGDVTLVNTAYTCLSTDWIVVMLSTTPSGAVIVLPDANQNPRAIIVVNKTSVAHLLSAPSGCTVDGATGISMTNSKGYLLIADGSNWISCVS